MRKVREERAAKGTATSTDNGVGEDTGRTASGGGGLYTYDCGHGRTYHMQVPKHRRQCRVVGTLQFRETIPASRTLPFERQVSLPPGGHKLIIDFN
jgi:hypothetical protein